MALGHSIVSADQRGTGMKRDIVAVFDSGVDPLHESFGLTGPITYEEVGGMRLDRLREIRRAAIHGELSMSDIAEIVETFPREYQYPRSPLVVPGRDFAGLHPDYDLCDAPATNIFDLNGHGTATAGILVMAGHAVLPIKVGYSLVPEISLPGLVEACDWLVEMVRDGLPCTRVVWTFGSSDPDVEPIYIELMRQLSHTGITIWASGRGALDSVEDASSPLWPADIDQIIAVDEELHLAQYTIRQQNWGVIAYGLPGSTHVLDQQLATSHGKIDTQVLCVTNDKLRCVDIDERQRYVTLVVGASRPYVFRPNDEVFPFPVLVTTAKIEGLPRPNELAMVWRNGTCVFRPHYVSSGRQRYGRTGILAPTALNPRGWVPTFGSSCAAPSAVAQ
jgi:subtilisin family serine protease